MRAFHFETEEASLTQHCWTE